MNVIWSLCRKYTDLSDEEIRIIEHMSETLQPLANLEALQKMADGKATKIIIPSEIQGLAGLAASAKTLLESDPPQE